MPEITPFLWFDNQAEEAANFYCSIFKNSRIINLTPMGATFQIEGQKFHSLNGGPMFKFTEAISIYVDCISQEEVDTLWNKLISDGGQESQCGWLKDKYGLSWQIIPKALMTLMGDPDPVKSQKVLQAMLKMKKIIIKDLELAHSS